MTINVRNNNGRCLIRTTFQGKRLSKTMGDYHNPYELLAAQKVALDVEYAIAKGQFTGDIGDYIEGAPEKLPSLSECLKQSMKGASERIYVTLLNKIESFGEVDSKAKATRFMNQHGGSGSTWNRYRATLVAVRPDLFGHIPKQKQTSGSPDPFSQEEIKSILLSFDKGLHFNLVYALVTLGLRTGELKGLERSDFCEEKGTYYVFIQRSYVRGEMRPIPKNKKTRKVYLKIQTWKAVRAPFMGNSNPYRNLSFTNFRTRSWKPCLEKLGIRYRRMYCLRHTAITLYLQDGGTPIDAARMFGTSIQVINNHYAGQTKAPKPL